MGAFSLENWEARSRGFSVVANVVEDRGSGDFALQSSIGKQLFGVQFVGDSPSVGDEVPLLNFALTWDGSSYSALQIDDSVWFVRASSALDGVFKIRELCAGIGALGVGATSLGYEIVSANDIQQVTCGAYARNSQAPVVHGDLTDPCVVGEMWTRVPGPAGICSGFSCQPFSAYGDQRAQRDPRSGTLPGTLRAAHWLQAPFVLLECVCPAGQHEWVRTVVADFCRETGFARTEVQLDTAQVWPCYRKRWWCLLTHPTLGSFQLQPWSADGRFQAVAQLIDNFHVSPEDLDQLCLTEHELEQFQACKPLASFCLQVRGRMPTALHSWGSQVYSCPCGCRGAFTEDRLARGISAVLVPFTGAEQDIAFRHLHPKELALLNGYPPIADFGDSLRLGLALLGQQASPLQSAWVLCQLKGFLLGDPDRVRTAGSAYLGMLSPDASGKAVRALQAEAASPARFTLP